MGRPPGVDLPGTHEPAVGALSRSPEHLLRACWRGPTPSSGSTEVLGPRVARGLLVSGDFFTVLGVERARGTHVHRRRRPAGLRRAGRGGQLRLLAAIPRRRSGGSRTDAVTQFTIGRSDWRGVSWLLGSGSRTRLRRRRPDLLAGRARRRGGLAWQWHRLVAHGHGAYGGRPVAGAREPAARLGVARPL